MPSGPSIKHLTRCRFVKASGILEGPTSFHIVRVENRRPAGPASFEELRPKIRPMLFEEKVKTERTAFISKLRERTAHHDNLRRSKEPAQ